MVPSFMEARVNGLALKRWTFKLHSVAVIYSGCLTRELAKEIDEFPKAYEKLMRKL